MMSDKTRTDEHPSYGMAGFYRSQGGNFNLFGSSLQHNNTIHLTVAQGVRYYDLHQDWYHGKGELLTIRFSPTQFAELLTTMNVGSGVPCTIERINGRTVEACPRECNKRTEIQDDFKDDIQRIRKRLADISSKCDKLLSDAKPTKAAREELKSEIALLRQAVESNLPFVLSQFTKAADGIVSQAKGEIDAAFTGAIHRMGVKALHESIGSEQLTVPALEYNPAESA